MFRKKSTITFLFILCLVLSVGGYAFAAGFSDIQGHWAESQINSWAEKGLAGGYSDGTFKPNNQVTRAEFVALTNRAFGIDTEGFTAGFSDVAAGQWYYNDIAAASASGYTGGYPDGTFKPKQSISRQEVASILVRLLELEPTTQGLEKFKDADQIPQWSRSSIGAIAKAGLMGGYPDGTFQPGKSITRAEAVVSLDRAREFAPGVIEEATLQGTVTLDDKAVTGATMRVFKAGSYEVLKETETDSNGYFEFPLAAGNYDITAVTSNKVAYQSDIVLAQNESTTADLKLVPAAVISGTLYDERKLKKVKEATLLFTTNPTFVLLTDKDGKFTGAVLPDRTYTVRVYEPGEEDEEPVLVNEELEVGAAGNRNVGILQAPFEVDSGGSGPGGPSGGGETGPIVLGANDIRAGETYSNSRGYKIASFGTFGPDSGTATFTTKLTIDPGDSGTLTLQNIEADTIEILSGGKNSVHTKNLKANKVATKAANGVRIEAGKGTVITETEVEGETHIAVASDASGDAKFGKIKIKPAANGKSVEFSGDLTESTVSVETGNVTLKAYSGVQMGKVVIEAPGEINLAGQGSFGDVEVSEKAGEGGTPVINVAQGTTVTKLVLSTTVELSGDVADVPLEVTNPDTVQIIVNDPDTKNELITKAKTNATNAIASINGTISLADEAAVVSARNKVNAVKVLMDDINSDEDIRTKIPELGIDRLIDAEKVIDVLKQINIGYASGDSAENVTKDLTLSTTTGGLTITWVSDKTNVIGTDGQVTRQESDVNVTLTSTINKGDITGKKTFTVTVRGMMAMPEMISFAGMAPGNDNTIEVPLTNISTNTGIEVSMDSKLALNVEGLGIIRQLSLQAGQVNNIYNILIPNVEEINVSELDLNKLYQATSECLPATKEQIIKAVNFTGLFELLKGKSGIKDSIINDTNLGDLLEVVSNDANINKGDILNAVNLEEMVDAVRGIITKDDISNVLSKEKFLIIIANIDYNDDLREAIIDATDELLDAQTNDEVAEAAKKLFQLINQTEESTQNAIAEAMNFTALFDVVKKADSAATEAVFNAISFTALFDAMSGASDQTIDEIINVTMQIIGIMQQYNITRSDILNNINFNELDKESIFNWLSCIDEDKDILTIEAILTDINNAGNSNIYTINISK